VIELGDHRYGKSAIRLVKVVRGPAGHAVRDLTIAIALEGAFEAAHTAGDNAGVVATDTMKNTAYAFAKDRLTGAIEAYGRELAEHFLEFEQVSAATVSIREHRWAPVPTSRGPSRDAFARDPSMTRLAIVSANRARVAGGANVGAAGAAGPARVTIEAGAAAVAGSAGVTIEAGIADLVVMKTAKSAFVGFPRDEFTTLPETTDRVMATSISARWRYISPDIDHDVVFGAVRDTLLDVFATHDSASVQASIWIMGRAILERHPELDEVSFSLPNLHHWLADLRPFGLTNDNEIFIATREPYGLIEATVRRS
jgi:urate oxidase